MAILQRMAAIHLGTSGYVYKHWKGLFYPDGLPVRRWLPYYARVFSTVELNATFYRLPTEAAVDGWREQVPRGFRFACKGSRFLTHLKRLQEVGEGVELFHSRVLRLGSRLGPLLWQLPPTMTKPDPERLERFLAHLPGGVRHVFEFRNAAWYHPEVLALLDAYGAAVCEHDLVDVPVPRPTGGFRYLRFHGAQGRYEGRYGRRALRRVADDVSAWRDAGRTAWVFFNNDLKGHALLDAFDLADLLGEPLHRPEPSAVPQDSGARPSP
ncbi:MULTISPECIES: DUF72 domain-containing protein [unclassified Corallococcus]|uniref:DUF72 domain-containing protein n=1 Tax=unclassified Corallococcus TaxID=2685029 RepID=UPI001F1E2F0E|nr:MULTISPECIES: DUF72 domain-containing protein [unclassified Corallococcus]